MQEMFKSSTMFLTGGIEATEAKTFARELGAIRRRHGAQDLGSS